jgi:hypothetical protein
VRLIGALVDIGDRDRGVLSFVAAHEVALCHQAAVFLNEPLGTAEGRLEELRRAGLLTRERVDNEGHGCVRITRAGLEAIGSRALPPRFDAAYVHSIGAVWLWLIARRGTFGPLEGVWSAREMRSVDEVDGPGAPFGFPLGEFGHSPKMHYPDLMLGSRSERMPIEFLLTAPMLEQTRAVMRACAADHRIGALFYFAADPRLGRLVQSVAASLELTPMVHVRSLPPIELR